MAPAAIEGRAGQFVPDPAAGAAASDHLVHSLGLGSAPTKFNSLRLWTWGPGDTMSHRMELLLILSALLSAATGAFTGTRGADAAPSHQASAEAVAVKPSVAIKVALAVLPGAAEPAAQAAFFLVAPTAEGPPSRLPVETDRLIE